MVEIDFNSIFYPKSVAVVGVSSHWAKWGTIILHNIIAQGYRGKIYPVNPNLDSIFGLNAYPSVESIPDGVDLGIVVVPASKVPGVLEGFEGKVRAALVISSGFGETEEGRALEEEITRIARKAGIPLVGPNTMGILSPEISFSALMPRIEPKRGTISFISQSGNLGTQIVSMGIEMGVGFSKFVGSGNEAVLTCEDYLEYFGRDPSTKVILVYIEGLRNGRRFFELAKRIGREKPIIVYKAGTTEAGSRAAKSHTGAMSGSNDIYVVAFKQAGIIVASTTEELIELASAFASQPLPRGRRVGILTRGGGWGVVGTDACCRAGLEVPSLPKEVFEELDRILPSYWSKGNPVDMVATIDPEVQPKCLEILARCREFDAVIALGGMGIATGLMPYLEEPGIKELVSKFEVDHAQKFLKLLVECGKPILSVGVRVSESPGAKFLEENGILTYSAPEKAVTVLARLVEYKERFSPPEAR